MKSQRSALIIASDDYTDTGLKRLQAPASDARALAAVLRDPGIGDFEVRTLLNEPAHEVILAVEEFFADRQPDDLLLLHFSGHAVRDEDGELYFATGNTRLRRLRATAVAAVFVNSQMNRSRSRRVVLLLDCTYVGAFEPGMTARAGEGAGIGSQFGGRGRAVITASSAMEYAFEGDQLADTRTIAPSVFTSALVEGLETGDADRDQDGLVALDELYDYVYDKVRTVTPNQTPGKWTFGMQGELVIARRPRPVTTPAPLPPEMQDVIDSPLAPVRAAAVQELARVLHGTHAGRALAARLALERLTGDDSRTVAAAAAEILRSDKPPSAPPRLELSATAVDFGRLTYRAQSPERRIRLRNAGGGSLNARAASEAKWLRLRLDGDELALTVDTARVGRHEYILAVDSDGGSGSVLVQASVEPAGNAAPAARVDDTPRAPRMQEFPDYALLPPAADLPASPIVDDDVGFTVYRPPVVSPGQWASLLVFAHKTTPMLVPGQGRVDPREQVAARARAHFDGRPPRPVGEDAAHAIPRGARLRIVPDLPGMVCNPPEAAVRWWEPVHEVAFRLLAGPELAGTAVRGAVRVWCGLLMLGQVSITIRVDATDMPSEPSLEVAGFTRRYHKIFPSYSHRDSAMVADFAAFARTLGDRYLQDVLVLRPGEHWHPRLLQLIEEADVFQLFWSRNSMRSPHCREEWEYALALQRPDFVLPVYWEEPRPQDPAQGLPPEALEALHFVKWPGAGPKPVSPPRPRPGSPIYHPTEPKAGITTAPAAMQPPEWALPAAPPRRRPRLVLALFLGLLLVLAVILAVQIIGR